KIGDTGLYNKYRNDLSEDPFQYLIKEAHAAGVEVHAWLNLLSLSENRDAPILKKYGTGVLTRNKNKKVSIEDYKIDSQYFLEPGDLRIREEMKELIKEILSTYKDLDGIQFDYIRYPDEHPFYGYTEMNLSRFKSASGLDAFGEKDPAWQDWKRLQVTEFLKGLVGTAKKIKPAIQVSATGCAPYVRAYYEAFQDWPGWLNSGLVDFVTLMSYAPQEPDFEKEVIEAQMKVDDPEKLKIGIGAYKLVKMPRAFERQINFCKKAGVRSYAIFHYGSLLENTGLKKILLSSKNKE
ncbi:MAG TPA: family 10 glycosylhydrolase, partial [Candidatus Omnitrophota bacterium]|nr:family 10 glycosylhydrolase [Candidatus Omnitrophota bacterium]